MRADLTDWRSFCTIVAEEGKDEVFKLQRKISSVSFLEIQVSLFLTNKIVEVLFFARFLKWEDALYYDEEDHAEWKHISLKTTVSLTLFDLGRHVSEGTAVATEAVDLLIAGEPKVSQFELQVVVD